jgi:hypothetical protein
MPSGVTHIHVFLFVYLSIILILVLGFYSGMPGRVRTVYLFSLCVVLLLPSRFTANALVWFSNFPKYLVFHFFISLSSVFICGSSWILWLFTYQGAFRIDVYIAKYCARKIWIKYPVTVTQRYTEQYYKNWSSSNKVNLKHLNI